MEIISVLGLLCCFIPVITSSGNDSWIECPRQCNCSSSITGEYSISDGVQVLQIDCSDRADDDQNSLPQEVDDCLMSRPNIEWFSLQHSNLSEVPPAVCNLTKLVYLDLTRNQLTKLPPDCLRNMTSLKFFLAEGNLLTEVPEGFFSGLWNLTKIELQRNRITRLYLEDVIKLSMMPNMKEIDFSNNELTNSEPWPFVRASTGGNATELKVRLNGNKISTFTNTIGVSFDNCSLGNANFSIDLHYNKFSHFEDLMNGWRIGSLDNFACNFLSGSKERLVLKGDRYLCDCVNYDFMKYIRERFSDFQNEMRCTTAGRAKFITADVRTFSLIDFVCDIRENCPVGCHCIQRPHNSTFHVRCDAAGPGLQTLPFQLPNPDKSRYKLEFSRNTDLKLEPRGYLANTVYLDVSNSGVSEITDSTWQSMTQIKVLLLHGNVLTILPESVTNINSSFQMLSLYNNSWSCSCENRWIQNYFKSVKDRLLNPDSIQCSSPSRLKGKSILWVEDDEFCTDPVLRVSIITISTVVGCVVLALVLACIVWKLRQKRPRYGWHVLSTEMDVNAY